MTKQEALEHLSFFVDHDDEIYSGYPWAHDSLAIAVECIEKCERNCINCKNYTVYELGYYCEKREVYVYPDMRCDDDWVARF